MLAKDAIAEPIKFFNNSYSLRLSRLHARRLLGSRARHDVERRRVRDDAARLAVLHHAPEEALAALYFIQ